MVQLAGRLGRRRHPQTTDNKVIVGPSTKIAAEIMTRLANSPAADPGLNVAQEGQSETALGARHRRVPDQLPVRVVGGQGRQSRASSSTWATRPFPSVMPGIAPKVSIGGYNLGVSAYSPHPAARLRRREVPGPAQEPGRATRSRAAWPRCWASIYDEPVVREGLSLPRADQDPAARTTGSARRRRPTPTSRWPSRTRCRRPPASIPNTIVSTLRNEIKQSLSSEALL